MANKRQVAGLKAKPNRAVRLTFKYDGDTVRLVRRTALNKVPPASDPTEGYEGQSGSWLEVRDARGRVVHRQVLHHPIKHDIEVFSGDPKRPFVRQMLDRPTGEFDVIVPQYDGAHSAVLFHSTHDRGIASGPSREFARFDLGSTPPGGKS
ncbi:MAG TPA: hypothetical protein VEV38_06240 [Candidatus Eremiobacteraceae bacterium]|nr:hypothetical protein [Candidatus Eremiobacteraceae bacterium]